MLSLLTLDCLTLSFISLINFNSIKSLELWLKLTSMKSNKHFEKFISLPLYSLIIDK